MAGKAAFIVKDFDFDNLKSSLNGKDRNLSEEKYMNTLAYSTRIFQPRERCLLR